MKNAFEKQLMDDLRSTENNLDPAIKRQLIAGRKKAVDSHQGAWHQRLQWAIWPATGMVTASVLMFMILLSPLSPLPLHDTLIVDEQSSESIDLLDDLDFYYWLSEHEEELRG